MYRLVTQSCQIDYVGDQQCGRAIDHAVSVDIAEYVARGRRSQFPNYSRGNRTHAPVPIVGQASTRDEGSAVRHIHVLDLLVMLTQLRSIFLAKVIFATLLFRVVVVLLRARESKQRGS